MRISNSGNFAAIIQVDRLGGYNESGLATASVFLAVQRYGDAPQGAVVHVQHARPGNLIGVELQVVAVEKMGIDEGREQIVRGRDGMKVAMKVKIDFRAGLNL